MTDEELAAIEGRCNAATDGPWYVTRAEKPNSAGNILKCATVRSKGEQLRQYPSIDKSIISQESWYVWPSPDDLELIAHARTDIPILLAEVKRLKEYERMYKDLQD